MKKITKRHYDDIFKELHFLEQQNIVTSDQIVAAKKRYDVQPPLSILSIVLTIGAILIGIGVLVAVSTSWAYLSTLVKFIILIGATLISYVAGFVLQTHSAKTSRAFYYIAIFIAITSLYFIEILYSSTSNFNTIALLSALIIAPLAYFLRDLFLSLLFSVAIFAVTINYYDASLLNIIIILPFLIALFWFNEQKLHHSKLLFTTSIGLALLWLTALLHYFNAPDYVVLLIIFALGITLFFTILPQYNQQPRWIGTIIASITASMLMNSWPWSGFSSATVTIINIVFTVGFAILAFSLLRIAQLHAIVFITTLIITIYYNYTFNLIPKSLFFISVGVVLIAFGYWFERTRREDVSHD